MTRAWKVTVVQDGRPVLERILPCGIATIGRSAHNHVVLDGPKISRFHAALFVAASGACHLQDMGSRNGTFVGARRIGRLRLEPGDRFTIGGYGLQAEVTSSPPPGEPGTDGDGPVTESRQQRADQGLDGSSHAARQLLARARRVADTDLALLVTGESGSGKGRLARAVHEWSARAAGPFVVVDCSSLDPSRCEAELFGEAAAGGRTGKFRMAHGGTLLLDEIGDLPPESQARLLRAIEEQVVQPEGADEPVRVDVRVIAATHRDLESAVAAGRFRLDLYHRLTTSVIRVPSLRERADDVVVLANVFLDELASSIPGGQGAVLTSDAVTALTRHEWAGNVRELRNVIAQALLTKEGEKVTAADLRFTRSVPAGEVAPSATLADAEGRHIARALEHHGWNLRRTARALGISRSTLHERMDRLGLREGRRGPEPNREDAG